MTEYHWLTTTRTMDMVEFLSRDSQFWRSPTRQQMWRFVIACCWSSPSSKNTPAFARQIQLFEGYIERHREPVLSDKEFFHPEWDLNTFVRWVASQTKGSSDILRCVVGNPFCSLQLSSAWENDQVLSLARAAHAEQTDHLLDNVRLSILADCLEEHGVTDQFALDHLRNGQKHWPGCHVVAAILNKGEI